jgi:hypothetical protein
VTSLEALKAFDVAGYYFSAEATQKENEHVFLRAEQN